MAHRMCVLPRCGITDSDQVAGRPSSQSPAAEASMRHGQGWQGPWKSEVANVLPAWQLCVVQWAADCGACRARRVHIAARTARKRPAGQPFVYRRGWQFSAQSLWTGSRSAVTCWQRVNSMLAGGSCACPKRASSCPARDGRQPTSPAMLWPLAPAQ